MMSLPEWEYCCGGPGCEKCNLEKHYSDHIGGPDKRSERLSDPLKYKRPDWDSYFISIAHVVKTRSEDVFIQHGTVITKDNKLVSSGYNGLPVKFDHNRINIYDREYRRNYYAHSELNAILFSEASLTGCTLYCTARSCPNCLIAIINSGIVRVVYEDKLGSITENDEQKEIRETLIEQSGINFEKFEGY